MTIDSELNGKFIRECNFRFWCHSQLFDHCHIYEGFVT